MGVIRLRRALPWVVAAVLVGIFVVAAAVSGPVEASRTLASLDEVGVGEEYDAGDLRWRIDGVTVVEDSLLGEAIIRVSATVVNTGHVPLTEILLADDAGNDLVPIVTWNAGSDPVWTRFEFDHVGPADTADSFTRPPFNPFIPTPLSLEIQLGDRDPAGLVGQQFRVILAETTVEPTRDDSSGFLWSEPELAAYVEFTLPEVVTE